MFIRELTLLLAITLAAAQAKRRLKVLVYSPSVGYSHMKYQGKLADLLVEAGHEVHVVMPDQNPSITSNGSTKAHQVIRVPAPRAERVLEVADWRSNPFSGMNNMLRDGTAKQMGKLLFAECQDVVENDALFDFLKAQRYDVAITESWLMCPFSLFHALGIPTRLATQAFPMTSNLAGTFGIPSPPSHVPFLLAATISGDQMSYLERVRNFAIRAFVWLMGDSTMNRIDAMFRAKFGSDFPGCRKIIANASLAFINANPLLDLPRPISHKTIYIGGVVEKEPKPLSRELERLVSTAAKGVVLFSFGSVADTAKMSHELKRSFLTAFAQFPEYEFIWKFRMTGNDSELFAQFPNVHPMDWIDQVSVLAHPKTRAFITHCGMNSLNEAAAHGVPTVAVPLFGDQLYNAAIVRKQRTGVFLDIRKITAQSVGNALDAVLSEPG